jgi:hypothetical protein
MNLENHLEHRLLKVRGYRSVEKWGLACTLGSVLSNTHTHTQDKGLKTWKYEKEVKKHGK